MNGQLIKFLSNEDFYSAYKLLSQSCVKMIYTSPSKFEIIIAYQKPFNEDKFFTKFGRAVERELQKMGDWAYGRIKI